MDPNSRCRPGAARRLAHASTAPSSPVAGKPRSRAPHEAVSQDSAAGSAAASADHPPPARSQLIAISPLEPALRAVRFGAAAALSRGAN